jgi:hypothetical protein
MITSRSYQVVDEVPYIPVVSIVASDVLVVDRNGIGVRHDASFTGSQSEDVLSFQWLGISLSVVTGGDYFIRISNLGNLTQTWLLSPVNTAGVVYIIWLGDKAAFYIVQSGDTTATVRNALVSAVNAVSWGFTATATAVGTDKIRIVTSVQTFWAYSLGKPVYKSGLYTTIDVTDYMISEAESNTGYPAIPAKAASYQFGDITEMVNGLAEWLRVPSQAHFTLTQSNLGSTNILNVPSIPGAVPAGQCVINENEQRIYFDAPLAFNEIIKVITK